MENDVVCVLFYGVHQLLASTLPAGCLAECMLRSFWENRIANLALKFKVLQQIEVNQYFIKEAYPQLPEWCSTRCYGLVVLTDAILSELC